MSLADNAAPRQETAQTKAYKAFLGHVRNIAKGIGTEDELKEWADRNAEVLALKDLRPNDVHQDEVMTNLSVMYANEQFIGDRVMPDIMTNGSMSAVYFSYNQRDRFAYPDDSMSTRTDPNELSQGRSKSTVALAIRSLQEVVDQYTLQNQSAPLNELLDAQQNVLYALAFKKEQRIATAATTAGNFGSNTVTLSAGDRWDTASGGDPGAVVDAAQKAMFTGNQATRTVAVASLDVYNALKRNPRILDMFKYGGEPGNKFATPKMLAEYFEVDEFLVGRARVDTANEGQASATWGRIWPNVLGIYRVAQAPSIRSACFGYTFQDMAVQSDLMFRQEKGAKGAYVARSSFADAQQIIAADTGFLIQSPIG
ncbi:MAG TPA: major capsid protein [Lacunisphaera sp.]|nr:major capsid protein [Lacunisphaera sp.]